MTELFDGLPFRVRGPEFLLDADGRRFTPGTMTRVGDAEWRDGDVMVRLELSTTPDGSRAVVLRGTGIGHVREVCLLEGQVVPAPEDVHNHRWFGRESTAVFLRGGDDGVFACYANPFGAVTGDDGHVRLAYRPEMDVGGTFRSDPLVVGPTRLEGRVVRHEVVPGRDEVEGVVAGYVDTFGLGESALDVGEARAVREAVAVRTPWQPARARSAHWDWGQNLFRHDVADPEAQAIYGRVSQLCGELGIENLLVAPGGPRSMELGLDAVMMAKGPWQHAMWLGQGAAVGAGEWSPGSTPQAISRVLDGAREHGLKPLAYTNPQFLWKRDDAWRVVHAPETDPAFVSDPDGVRQCCLAVPEAQRWLIETARRFADDHDVGGLSFDFVFWFDCHATDHGHAPGPGSRYAQWDGYRRVLAAVREARPEAWVETLIGGMELLPWGVADVTHPHPNMGDNQPQWVPAWPDLSLDRACANYQRRVGYWFRNFALIPPFKVPGQVGHQANRQHFRNPERGWDWEGARYNLLSAIASGPSSLSVCFLPGWDEAEWQGMRDRDGEFFARWIAFARDNDQVLARLEDLWDEPRPGAVDGTIALDDDGRGFAFLANPDHVELAVDVPLPSGAAMRELYPQEGRLWQQRVTVEPHTVTVLEVIGEETLPVPTLYGMAGTAAEQAGEAVLTTAEGVPGSVAVAAVRLGSGDWRELTVRFSGDGVTPTLGPWSDQDGREVDLGTLDGKVRITTGWTPGDALPGLLASLAPPVAPTGDEARDPWSDPSRLRIFPAITDPKAVHLQAWVDGEPVEVHKAYVGTYADVTSPSTGNNNLLGHYIDLTRKLATTTNLQAPWVIELEVALAWAGQLTGVHVAHLPRRTTHEFTIE